MPIVNKHDPKAIYKIFAEKFPKLVLGAYSYTYVGTGAIKLKYTDGRYVSSYMRVQRISS